MGAVELSGTGYAVVRVDRDQPEGGTGTVNASGFADEDCDGTSCSYLVQSPEFTLTAVGNGMRFVEWQDACEGSDTQCTPPLTGDQRVVAVFESPTTSSAPPPDGTESTTSAPPEPGLGAHPASTAPGRAVTRATPLPA